ncbi:hypothetical protein, partial [Ilumatobacter sp.]|uniref:hypothetical protein n=1 Tax=Ilumatobacter sp. TaxID=1967498 RepID=UPI0037535C4B
VDRAIGSAAGAGPVMVPLAPHPAVRTTRAIHRRRIIPIESRDAPAFTSPNHEFGQKYDTFRL